MVPTLWETVWSDDGAGNLLKAEPMCTTKTAVAGCPWWRQNLWKVCWKQFCRTGASQIRNSLVNSPDVSFTIPDVGARLPTGTISASLTIMTMLWRYIVLLIAIRLSDGDVKPGGPLGAFREEQAMSRHRHRVSPSPYLSSSSHTTQLHYTNSYTSTSSSTLLQILVPHVMWSSQAVRELKIDHTQRHLSVLRGTRRA